MAYYPSRDLVKRHTDLLKQINHAVEMNEEIYLEPAQGQSMGGARYWVRNLLKSAELYSEFGYADLAASVTVGLSPDRKVKITPKTGPSEKAPSVQRFDEMMAMSELMAERGRQTLITFWPSEAFDVEGFMEAANELGWDIDLANFVDGHWEAHCIRHSDSKLASPFDLIGD